MPLPFIIGGLKLLVVGLIKRRLYRFIGPLGLAVMNAVLKRRKK